MRTLDEIRVEIDEIDRQMAALFEKRMAAAAEAGAWKRSQGLPVLDKTREEALVQKNLARLTNPPLAPYYTRFITHLMSLSRQYQQPGDEE